MYILQMIKRILTLLIITLVPSLVGATGVHQTVVSSTAAALSKFSNEKIDEFFSNLVPGEGITETSIQLRENQDPDFSILGTRGLKDINNGTQLEFFIDFELNNPILNSIMKKSFELGLNKIAKSFEERAIKLYK